MVYETRRSSLTCNNFDRQGYVPRLIIINFRYLEMIFEYIVIFIIGNNRMYFQSTRIKELYWVDIHRLM